MSDQPEEPDFIDRINNELENVGKDIVSNAYLNAKQRLIQDASDKLLGYVFGDQSQSAQELAPPESMPPLPGQQIPPVIPSQQSPQKPPNPNISFEDLQENLQWYPGISNGRAAPFTLAAPTDHFNTSDPVTTISPGEYFIFYFRVITVGEAGDFQHNLNILFKDSNDSENGWCINFASGREEIEKGNLKLNGKFSKEFTFDLPQYKVNKINQCLIEYDGKECHLYMNGEPIRTFITLHGHPLELFFRVVGMDVSIWG